MGAATILEEGIVAAMEEMGTEAMEG
jgi:hypothetical protein